MLKVVLFLGLIVSSVCSSPSPSLTPNTFITSEDKARFSDLFKLTEPYTDLPVNNLYYSLVGSNVLTNDRLFTILNTQQTKKVCDYLQSNLADAAAKLDSIYFSSLAAKLLNCQVQPNVKVLSLVESNIKPDVTVADLYKSTLSLINLGKPIDSAKVSRLLQAALKKDETLLSAGLSFRLAAHLQGAENVAPFLNKVSEVIMQADEVNGRYLQFEGGLGITASIILGIYSLASASGKPVGLTNDQVIKFTNYFLNRKTVQTIKGSADLLEVLKILSQNKYHIPVCVSLYDSPALSSTNPLLSIYVNNVLGQSLGSDLSVTAESTAWAGKATFKPVEGDSTMFALDVIESKPKRGTYDVTISVSSKPDSKLIGNTGAVVKINILTTVLVEKAEIGIVDKDQSGPLKATALQFPQSNKDILDADQQQKMVLKFSLKDRMTNDPLNPHQVFVRVQNAVTKKESIYVAETESGSDAYKFDLNLAQRAKDFGFNSGLYHVSLIVGDFVISNPFVWNVASVRMTFSGQSQASRNKV